MHLKPITTAVFPVAGLGTRFLPITKAAPKEMLPIVDKPIIQYVVEEAVQAGIKHLVFVTSSSKRAIEDYFDSNFELETRLQQSGKMRALKTVKDILPPEVTLSYVRQPQPQGLGHAVLCAQAVVGNQPFAVLLADDIIYNAGVGCLQQMIALYQQQASSVVAVETVPLAQTDQYGIVAVDAADKPSAKILNIVEKPKPQEAPSQLAVTGRYILTPEIFACLQQTQRGKGGEIQLTDAIARLMQQQAVYALAFEGKRFDCGSKIGYLQAVLHYALQDLEIRDHMAEILAEVNAFVE